MNTPTQATSNRTTPLDVVSFPSLNIRIDWRKRQAMENIFPMHGLQQSKGWSIGIVIGKTTNYVFQQNNFNFTTMEDWPASTTSIAISVFHFLALQMLPNRLAIKVEFDANMAAGLIVYDGVDPVQPVFWLQQSSRGVAIYSKRFLPI